MTLVDPTSGLGYSFGQKLPSTHMTTIATNQPKAVDGDGGGTWTPSAPIILNGTSALQLGGMLKYTSRNITRAQPIIPQVTDVANWNWVADMSGLLTWKNLVTATRCQVELTKLAHNSTVSEVRLFFQGGGGHAALPAVMPAFRLYRINTSGVYVALGASTNDPSANVAAYEAAHSVNINLTASFVVDLTQYRYILAVASESGANYQTGGSVLAITTTMAVTEQAEG